jgi:hypothetical protein
MIARAARTVADFDLVRIRTTSASYRVDPMGAKGSRPGPCVLGQSTERHNCIDSSTGGMGRFCFGSGCPPMKLLNSPTCRVARRRRQSGIAPKSAHAESPIKSCLQQGSVARFFGGRDRSVHSKMNQPNSASSSKWIAPHDYASRSLGASRCWCRLAAQRRVRLDHSLDGKRTGPVSISSIPSAVPYGSV